MEACLFSGMGKYQNSDKIDNQPNPPALFPTIKAPTLTTNHPCDSLQHTYSLYDRSQTTTLRQPWISSTRWPIRGRIPWRCVIEKRFQTSCYEDLRIQYRTVLVQVPIYLRIVRIKLTPTSTHTICVNGCCFLRVMASPLVGLRFAWWWHSSSPSYPYPPTSRKPYTRHTVVHTLRDLGGHEAYFHRWAFHEHEIPTLNLSVAQLQLLPTLRPTPAAKSTVSMSAYTC